MKKALLLVAFLFSLVIVGSALRVQPGSHASGDSTNVGETLVYRDASGDFAAATITAAALTVTGATTQTGALSISSATLTGSLRIAFKPKTFFDTTTPALGDAYLCSDCTITYQLCVATAAAKAGFRASHSATVGCGTNQ